MEIKMRNLLQEVCLFPSPAPLIAILKCDLRCTLERLAILFSIFAVSMTSRRHDDRRNCRRSSWAASPSDQRRRVVSLGNIMCSIEPRFSRGTCNICCGWEFGIWNVYIVQLRSIMTSTGTWLSRMMHFLAMWHSRRPTFHMIRCEKKIV